MSAVTFNVLKCKKRDDGWHHPRLGTFLTEDANSDVFVLEAINQEEDKIIALFVMERNCLEQIMDNCDKALTVAPLKIRRCP